MKRIFLVFTVFVVLFLQLCSSEAQLPNPTEERGTKSMSNEELPTYDQALLNWQLSTTELTKVHTELVQAVTSMLQIFIKKEEARQLRYQELEIAASKAQKALAMLINHDRTDNETVLWVLALHYEYDEAFKALNSWFHTHQPSEE